MYLRDDRSNYRIYNTFVHVTRRFSIEGPLQQALLTPKKPIF